jgi:hypothetical protein
VSLRKSPTRTPAFLEAIHRNAQKSTGPWTVRGKAQSCLNRLKTGERSRVLRRLRDGLLEAPPGAVQATARALLSREQALHPVFDELVGLARWAEGMVVAHERHYREFIAAKQKEWVTGANVPPQPTDSKSESLITRARGGGKAKKKMLEIDVGSRNVIENTRNKDILSCYPTDILGRSEQFMTENSRLGVATVAFSMRSNRQCRLLAMPRCEPQNLPDARRANDPRHALTDDIPASYK